MHIHGNEAPSPYRRTSKGSIDATILTDILRTLDELDCYEEDWHNGFNPILLLDAHGSMAELNFLEYINSRNNIWIVCIGVLYGTSLWQVGISAPMNVSVVFGCNNCGSLYS